MEGWWSDGEEGSRLGRLCPITMGEVDGTGKEKAGRVGDGDDCRSASEVGWGNWIEVGGAGKSTKVDNEAGSAESVSITGVEV